jgi:predicted RNase H-like HicB family nuclease
LDLHDTSHISEKRRKCYKDIFTKFEKEKMKFNITIEIDEDGRYVVECTDLPGCFSEGDSLKEAIENISEAIVGCLKSRLKVAGKQLKIPSFDHKLDISLDITGTTYA